MKRILIVDDEKFIGHMITKTVDNMGYDTKFMVSSKQAIDMGLEEFDLILTDWHMSEVHGKDFCRHISETYSDMPIIVISGSEVKPDNNNIKATVMKPFNIESLKNTIDSIFEY